MAEKFDALRKKFPQADVLIEPMEKGNVEIIIGLLNDPTFGIIFLNPMTFLKIKPT